MQKQKWRSTAKDCGIVVPKPQRLIVWFIINSKSNASTYIVTTFTRSAGCAGSSGITLGIKESSGLLSVDQTHERQT